MRRDKYVSKKPSHATKYYRRKPTATRTTISQILSFAIYHALHVLVLLDGERAAGIGPTDGEREACGVVLREIFDGVHILGWHREERARRQIEIGVVDAHAELFVFANDDIKDLRREHTDMMI